MSGLCKTCRWWRSPVERSGHHIYQPVTRYGECRRYPPFPMEKRSGPLFTVTIDNDWCGEWQDGTGHQPSKEDR